MTNEDSMYNTGIVKGPHKYRGKEVYYVTVSSKTTDIYLRKDGTVGQGTKAASASDETRGFWDTHIEAYTALSHWKVEFINPKPTEESKPKEEQKIKRYTKKEFLILIKGFV